MQAQIFLGIGLLLSGLAFFLLIWAVLRIVIRNRPTGPGVDESQPTEIESHKESLLVVETGGRIRDISENARVLFELAPGEIPNLERLSRRVRPSQGFIEICAAEGQSFFSINGKLVHAVSYRVTGTVPCVLVTLQRTDNSAAPANARPGTMPGVSLKLVSDFGDSVGANPSLEATAEAILVNVEHLIASDYMEIKAWDETAQTLIPFRMEGATGTTRTIQRGKISVFGDYANQLVSTRKELFIPDTRISNQNLFDPISHSLPQMGSYIGLPLLAYGQLIGTLEVGVLPVNGFDTHALHTLQIIAKQASVAMRNAELYETQQRWRSQLAGLTNLAKVIGSLDNLNDLLTRVVGGLSSLFNFEFLGILLYDEHRRVLEGQSPFQGLPTTIVKVYKTPVHPNSLLEKNILSQKIISTPDASQDPVWAELGLQVVALAAAVHDTTLIPLISSGKFFGYIQLSNDREGETSISQDNLRLLNIVSVQVAAIFEKALLEQQAQYRSQRVEAMRRITNRVSSSDKMDDILRDVLAEVANLFQVDAGSIFILDENAGVMRAHLPSAFGVPADLIDSLSRINVKPSDFRLTVAGSQTPFISGNLIRDRRVLPLYRAIVRRLSLVSGLVLPLVVDGKGIGEMMLGTLKEDYFSSDDLQIAATIAGQLAVAINSSRHFGDTDLVLRRKADNLTIMNRITRELNSTSSLKELTRIVYDECLLASGAKCGAVSLFDQEIPGAEGRTVMFHLGHAASETCFEPTVETLRSSEPRLLTEPGAKNPPHDGVTAVLICPISYQDNTVGLIELHAMETSSFEDVAIEMIKNIAIQGALAIENALRLADQQNRTELFRRRADTLMQLFETSKNLRIDDTLVSAMGSIAQGIQKATPFNVVLVSLYDTKTDLLTRIVATGIDEPTFAKMRAHQQHWTSVAQLMKNEFEIGNLYFIPVNQAPVIPADVQFIKTMPAAKENPGSGTVRKPNSWDPDDILLIPIYDNNLNPLGLISVDDPRDGQRPDRIALETLEVFATQAALTITSGLSIQNYRAQIDNLNREVNRQKNLVNFSQSSLPVLLHKDLDLTLALSQMVQRAHHIRASLQVTEAISRHVDSNTALFTLGEQILTSFNMSVTLVARETPDGPHIVQTIGNLPGGLNPETSFGQRNPLRNCLQTGETIICENLDEDETWHDTPFLASLRAKSFFCFPVIINNKPIAAVLAVDTEPMPVLSVEDRQVYVQVSRQVSIILQNISLLSETRQRLQEVNLLLDFSRQLSGLKPDDILKSLLESALHVVSPAHAGVVFRWDANNQILVPLAASNYPDDASIMGISYHLGEGLPGRIFTDGRSRGTYRVAEVNFVTDYNLPPENLLKYRKATGGRLPVSSILLPILAGTRWLGAIVLDNFNTPGAFQSEHEAILLSLTQQVALSLENVRLMQTTEERSSQIQALNAVAATLTSSLQREELVISLLDRMATIIPYDTAILWLRQENKMVVADARGFGDNEERKGLTVAVSDSVLLNEMTRSGQAIVVNDMSSDSRFTSLVRPDNLAWMGIPLITKGQVIGVLALEKAESHFYTAELMQLSTTFASQAAVAIDNANLFEESVRRAAELDERSQRLGLLNKFSAELGGSLSSEQVINLTVTQLMDALGIERSMLLLMDKNDRNYLLSVLPEENGRPFIYRSLPASWVLNHLRESQTVYAAEDVTQELNLASLIDIMPDIQSTLILPLVNPGSGSGANPGTGSDSLYAIMLQSKKLRRFTATEIELARTIGNQAAIALENADLYQSALATAERLSILNQASTTIGASLKAEDIYRAAYEAASKLMSVDSFVIALLDENTREVNGVYIMELGKYITDVRIPYGQGLSGQVISTGQPILTLQAIDAENQGGVTIGERGTPHSIVAVPMISGGRVIGSLSAQSYQMGIYSQSEQQILSTLANQVTAAILNARLLAETQSLASTLEQRVVERTAQLEHEQHNTETLLRILTEVTASLDLDRALNRTLALLSDAIGAEQSSIMMLQDSDNKLHYRVGYDAVVGNGELLTVNNTDQRIFKVGEGLSGWAVKFRQPVLVNDLRLDARWLMTQNPERHRSALVVPLVVGEDVIGTINVFHHKTSFFGSEALEMVTAIGSQVAIAINNAQLYQLIREQAERLGSLLRQQQMEARRQTAILEAVADGILVTDPNNLITFVNVSVERILDVKEAQMQGFPLENFAGLFSQASQTWIQTVKEWSKNPGINQVGEMYAEQINLDNGRVALVHLAPVIWRNEFLGTVSIFRDITREVEVDRLKSEFVATVSHELRTPMTSIRGYVDLLLMGAAGAMNENQVHFLDIVKSNTERLNILVNDLLDVSKIAAERVVLSIRSLDLREVAAEVVSDLQRRSQKEKKLMEIALEADINLPNVLADPERLRQILGNLMDNAYNYTPVDGKINMSLHLVDDGVEVDVTDSGIGISPEQQERIFERFYRGEDPLVLATPGTGLGLSIVKNLVEMHHGKIWMKSMGIPGQGSTFSFTLPVPKTEE